MKVVLADSDTEIPMIYQTPGSETQTIDAHFCGTEEKFCALELDILTNGGPQSLVQLLWG